MTFELSQEATIQVLNGLVVWEKHKSNANPGATYAIYREIFHKAFKEKGFKEALDREQTVNIEPLDASINLWERMLDAYKQHPTFYHKVWELKVAVEPTVHSMYYLGCPLCEVYRDRNSNNCTGCPVGIRDIPCYRADSWYGQAIYGMDKARDVTEKIEGFIALLKRLKEEVNE